METLEMAKYVVLGNVDAGKSTFIGVMKNKTLDDGRGSARSTIVKLKHEAEFGRTSSHSLHYIVCEKEIVREKQIIRDDEIVNTKEIVCQNEITTLIDLCGHERYFKTTLFGVMGLFCDYGIITIAANDGLGNIEREYSSVKSNTVSMTKEHIMLLMYLKIPFIIVVTKMDVCTQNSLITLKKQIGKIFSKDKNRNREALYVENDINEKPEDIVKIKDTVRESFKANNTNIVPIIMTSSKTGLNIDFVRDLLTSIPSKSINFMEELKVADDQEKTFPPVMFVDNTYSVSGVGIVLSGTVKYGDIKLGDSLFVGPLDGEYIPITVKSIHNCISQSVDILPADSSGSIAIRLETKKSYMRRMFHKGQIITPDLTFAENHTCRNMRCIIGLFDHSTMIRNGYQTVVHCLTIRQSVRFRMEKETYLNSNQKAEIDIQFSLRPEFVLPGSYFMFRDGKTKGMGKVMSIEPITRNRKKSKK